MKKTFAVLMAFAGMAFASTTVTINGASSGDVYSNGGTDSSFIFDVTENASISRIIPETKGANVKDVTLRVEDGKTLTVTGGDGVLLNNKAQTNFNGKIEMGKNSGLTVTSNISFNTSNGNASYSTEGSITLGQGATISARSLSFVAGQTNKSLSIAGVFGAEQMTGLTSGNLTFGDVVNTQLITLTNGVTGLGVELMSFSDIDALNTLGYANAGVITDASTLTAGQYGLVYSQTGFTLTAVALPEPTTATISLLALAGLASRRRRH